MARSDPLNIARFWQDPRTSGLSLMQADFRTQEYAPHRHEALLVAATETGGSIVTSRNLVTEAGPGTLLVLNPDEPQASRMGRSGGWRYRAFYLEEEALASLRAGLGIARLPFFSCIQLTDGALAEGFLTLHRALEEGCDGLRERELMIATFGALFRRYGGPEPRIAPAMRDRALFAAVAEIVRTRLPGPISLDLLATALELTEFQLIGLFKRTIGLTPHAYITQLRLDRARRSLAFGLPIAAAAIDAGFYDQSALTRHFKRCYGVTPLVFARAVRL